MNVLRHKGGGMFWFSRGRSRRLRQRVRWYTEPTVSSDCSALLRLLLRRYEVVSDSGPDSEFAPAGRTVVWRERSV